MLNPWFKFYGSEYLSDPKILGLSPDYRSCWITLLCLASQTKDGSIRFLEEDQVIALSGVKEKIPIYAKFEKLDMVTLSNGNVTIKNWEKRQLSEEAFRVRKHRRNENVTEGNENVTTEEKREEEKRIEESKNTYGEFKNVLLKDEEYGKLVEKMGENNTRMLIEELSGYIASKKVRYASHYATILNWGRRRVTEHQSKLQAKAKTIA